MMQDSPDYTTAIIRGPARAEPRARKTLLHRTAKSETMGHAYPGDTQGGAKWPGLTDDESGATAPVLIAHAGASLYSRMGVWYGTSLVVDTSSGSRPAIRSVPDPSAKEAGRSSLSLCRGNGGTDNVGRQLDKPAMKHVARPNACLGCGSSITEGRTVCGALECGLGKLSR